MNNRITIFPIWTRFNSMFLQLSFSVMWLGQGPVTHLLSFLKHLGNNLDKCRSHWAIEKVIIICNSQITSAQSFSAKFIFFIGHITASFPLKKRQTDMEGPFTTILPLWQKTFITNTHLSNWTIGPLASGWPFWTLSKLLQRHLFHIKETKFA